MSSCRRAVRSLSASTRTADPLKGHLAREQGAVDELRAAGHDFAAELAGRPPVALAQSKRLVNESVDEDREPGFEGR